MPPETIQGRAIFRQEAIEHRRMRHLGAIILLRPLSLRLVTLFPLLVVALLGFALSRLDFRPMFGALVQEAPAPGQGLTLILEPSLASQLHRGDELELRFAGSPERSRAVISELSTGPCSREARAFLLSSSRPTQEGCLQLQLASSPALALPSAPLPLKVQVWAPPRKYLEQLLHE